MREKMSKLENELESTKREVNTAWSLNDNLEKLLQKSESTFKNTLRNFDEVDKDKEIYRKELNMKNTTISELKLAVKEYEDILFEKIVN
eukprot:UN05646